MLKPKDIILIVKHYILSPIFIMTRLRSIEIEKECMYKKFWEIDDRLDRIEKHLDMEEK